MGPSRESFQTACGMEKVSQRREAPRETFGFRTGRSYAIPLTSDKSETLLVVAVVGRVPVAGGSALVLRDAEPRVPARGP